MKNLTDIHILIIESDSVQSGILKDKLLEYNAGYQINQFQNGNELFAFLKTSYHPGRSYYLILNYYLHTEEQNESMSGLEIIKHLNEFYSKMKIIIFSSFDTDGEKELQKIKEEPNVIDFIKKTEYGYSGVQNIIRFHYSESSLMRKKRRFRISLLILIIMVTLASFHFIFSFLAL